MPLNYCRKFATLTVLAALCAAPRPATAYNTDSQLWAQFVLNGKFQPRVRYFAEIQPRQGDHFARLSTLLLRSGVGYQVSPTMSLWLGYAWAPSFLPTFRNEHRPFQQLVFENNLGNIGLTNRTRLEERILEGAGGTSVRLRHMVRGFFPLDKEKRWAAVCYNEVFFNLNTVENGPQSGFDQDRLYFAGSHTINRHTRLEAGYQATFINAPGNRPNRRLDTLLMSINYNL